MANYGLTHFSHLQDFINVICGIVGKNGGNANALVLETIATETSLGTLEDKTVGAGMGLSQFDKIPFYDIRDRTSPNLILKIKSELGIDIRVVEWEHLRYNPLLSVLFCRLFYKLIKEEIPSKLELRAMYWKKYYNTKFGKGTVEHYIKSVERMEEFKAKLL